MMKQSSIYKQRWGCWIELWVDFASRNDSDDEQISRPSMRKKEEFVYIAYEK